MLGALAPAAGADDWPQWRGPSRDGKSGETGLLQAWPDGGPSLEWKVRGLGGGYSSLSVADGRIFTMGDLGNSQYVIALDESNGQLLWRARIGERWDDRYGGPRATPTVDGDHIYAMGTEGDLVCLEAETGIELWRRNLQEDFGGVLMRAGGEIDWRYAESPLVDGDWVVVTPGGPEAMLVALNKTDGEEVWRTALPELGEGGLDGAGYSSVVISHGAGVKQYVQLVGRGVFGVEAETGRFLWGYNRVANDVANIPTPVIDGDYVLASSGYGQGTVLLELEAEGDGVRANEIYFHEGDVVQNHHGGLILDQGTVYTGTAHNKGFPLSMRLADGEVLWGPIRNEGSGSAAVTYADGRLYFRYQDGMVILVETSPEGYHEHGSFRIPDIANFSWSHPVIAGGKLYLREQENLLCYNITAPEESDEAEASR
jgi:outer membrane protein assembly factor BamB